MARDMEVGRESRREVRGQRTDQRELPEEERPEKVSHSEHRDSPETDSV